jgi:predicted permease
MRILDWLFRRRRDDDLQAEISAHLSMAATDRIEDGADREAARLAALKEFGNVTLTREATRLTWGETWRELVSDLFQDVRYALRVLRRSPGYSFVVIAVLTLGIGANIAVFSVFKGVVLKPLRGIDNSASLAVLANRTTAGRTTSLSHPDFRDIRGQDQSFVGMAGATDVFFNIGVDGANHRATGELVTGNYFQVLGVRAQLGRTLLPSDDTAPGQHPVAVISDGVWKRVFGSDPRVVGRRVTINGQPMTIVGVTEPEFQGTVVSQAMGLWVPVMMQAQVWPPDRLADRSASLLWGIGRLRPGTTLASASERAHVASARLADLHTAEQVSDRAAVIPMWRSPYGAQTYMLPILIPVGIMGVLLLLIVCANVANLVLVRGVSRRGEIAARLALGASRGRILRLLCIESVVLSVPAALAGLMVARALMLQINQQSSDGTNQAFWLDVSTDAWVVAFAVLVASGSALVFGFAPALRSSRLELASIMKDDLSPRAGSKGRVRAGLVVAQVAVSLVMLVGAGLVVRSLDSARDADPGFVPEHVGLIDLDVSGSFDEARGRVFYQTLLERVRSEPGVEAASLASRLPLRMVEGGTSQIAVEGYDTRTDDDLRSHVNRIGSDYFRTMRVELLAGREFTRDDHASSPDVAIVNETMARRFWKTPAEALGKRVRLDGAAWKVVVGVVRDLKYFRLNERPRPYVYAPFDQMYWAVLTLHVRSADRSADGSAAAFERVRQSVVAMNPNMPAVSTRMLTGVTQQAVSLYGVFAGVLGTFGIVALLLAALGTYGLVSYSARQSAHEIGIRIAIGANRSDVLRRFLGNGLRLGAWGTAAGVIVSLALTRLLASLLYGVSPTDVVSFGTATATVMVIVLAASFFPAWRASRTDPSAALRHR